MIMEHICSWQHQSTSRGRWAMKRLLVEIASHLEKKLFLPRLHEVMLYEEDKQDPQKQQLNLPKSEIVLQGYWVTASWKSLPDILQNTEESDWKTANIGKTVFEISYFVEKSARYYGPVGWIWVPTRLQKNFGWLSRKWDISVKSQVLQCISCLLRHPSWVFDGVEE